MASARRAEMRWLTRAFPFFLSGCVGLATYVVVKRICVDFFLYAQHQPGTAIAFLVVYFFLLSLTLLSYFRLLFVIQHDPGVTPLGPKAIEQQQQQEQQRKSKKRKRRGLEGTGEDLEAGGPYGSWRDNDPDSPGLELFYSKEVFVCNTDGRPRYCTTCCNWKRDRVHHCSEIERCVKKMDHYCPWVGGIVGETSFKYFVQFTSYAALYWILVVVMAALCLRSLVENRAEIDGLVIAILVLGIFFTLFATSMSLTSVRYVCINLTNVDYLKSKNIVHQLAIRVPRGTPPGPDYSVITYPIPKPFEGPNAEPSSRAVGEGANGSQALRDQLATRTFAIVRTERGENPWDLGFYRNWKSVMGDNVIDWLLPFNPSPCASFENNESFYEMGSLVEELRKRFRLPEVSSEKEAAEMRELGRQQARGGESAGED